MVVYDGNLYSIYATASWLQTKLLAPCAACSAGCGAAFLSLALALALGLHLHLHLHFATMVTANNKKGSQKGGGKNKRAYQKFFCRSLKFITHSIIGLLNQQTLHYVMRLWYN